MAKNQKSATESIKRGEFSRKSFFALPPEIEKDIQSHDWVYRWGSTAKLTMQNGADHRGYQAYRVPVALRKTAEAGVYVEDYQISPDGLFHRGDMTLMIMPRQRKEENLQDLERERKLDRQAIRAAIEGRGLTVEEMKFERQAIIPKNLEEEDNG